jgi:hypothetical protein
MSISHTCRVPLNEPSEEIDLRAWLFGVSDADYPACAKGHQGAGVFTDEQGPGMINAKVELQARAPQDGEVGGKDVAAGSHHGRHGSRPIARLVVSV